MAAAMVDLLFLFDSAANRRMPRCSLFEVPAEQLGNIRNISKRIN